MTVLWDNAIKANQREFKYSVNIYFDGNTNPPINFTEDIVTSIDLLEETFAESQTPLGAVSSNELTIYLYNEDKQFSPKYISSSYYGKLVPNIKIEASVGIKVIDGTYEYTDLGTFYTTDWDAPTDSLIASVICHDRLFNFFNLPMPQLPIQEEINMASMFTMLFNVLGLTTTDYEIDNIAYGISIAALPESSELNIRDGMQQMAERSLVNVFVTRKGIIRVLRNNNVESISHTWTDSNMIIKADIPQKYSNIYSQAEIAYHIPFVGEQVSVFTIESIEIPTNGLILNNLLFSSVVGDVENVQLIDATNSYIDSMTIGARSISLTIANTGVPEDVSIAIYGRLIDTIDAKYTETDSVAQTLVGSIKFAFDSEYIQSKTDAITYAEKILPLVTTPDAYITINSRGNPSIILTNSMLINDIIDQIVGLEIVPIRMHYNFTNGLSCDTVGINKSVRELV